MQATFYGTDAWSIHQGSCQYGYLGKWLAESRVYMFHLTHAFDAMFFAMWNVVSQN
jgi:hypothetical protein